MSNRFDDHNRSSVKEQIIDSYKRDRLIPFVGAGLSKNIDGFPDWDEFIVKLKQDLVNQKIIDADSIGFDSLRSPFEKTEFYVREVGWQLCKGEEYKDKVLNAKELDKIYKKGRKELLKKIKEILSPKKNKKAKYNKDKWAIHNLLVQKFSGKKIYTTNWDLVLENSRSKCREKVNIVKYHGDYRKSFDIVACETDYMNRMSKDTHLDIIFKSDLLQNDFIFLGYSFRDPNIKFNLYQLREVINAARISYAAKIDLGKIFWITNEIHDITNLILLSSIFSNIRIYPLIEKLNGDEIKKVCIKKGYDGSFRDEDGIIKCCKCAENNSRLDIEKKCVYQNKYNEATREKIIELISELKKIKK
jgi:hypothetical protein